MQYAEAIDYLYSRLPVFHRIGAKAIKPGLGNILLLCEALGNPQHQFTSIHVAGTNGKGSTSHMLASIYQSAGYRVGLYTSPHLRSFTERIRINGQPIPDESVSCFVEQQRETIERIEPSFFEVTVAMAFDYFARESVDIALIEVGLGGRLDSTNVITPVASVITNIGYDHTDILGDTLSQIAGEKAGIMKPGVPVLIGETHPETERVFRAVADAVQAPILFADQRYTIQDKGIMEGLRHVQVLADNQPVYAITLDLLGEYQLKNLPSVLATVDTLQPRFPVSLAAVQAGLAAVTIVTGLKGRFQTLQDYPRVIADTAHNEPGLAALFQTVHSMAYVALRIVIGLVADKDRGHILDILPKTATYYFCQAHTPRSLPAADLQAEAALAGLFGRVYPDVNGALSAALEDSSAEDLILITGSNYTIAELTNL